jgi:hypothetical protein
LEQRLALVRIFCAGLIKIIKPLFGGWLRIIGLVERNPFKQVFGFYRRFESRHLVSPQRV